MFVLHKRLAARRALWLGLLLMIVSCSKVEPPTLRISLWDFNQWVDDSLFAAYQELHPEIKIKIESESWFNYGTKLNTQIIARNAPDVMLLKANEMYKFCDNGILLDLSELIEENRYDLNALFPNSVESCRWGGKTYALPLSNDVSVLYLNTAIFERYDVGVPSIDSVMTWADMMELCGQLADGMRKEHESACDFVYVEDSGWMECYSAILQNGAAPFDRLEDPKECLFNAPGAMEACEYYFNYSLKYRYSPTVLEYISVFKNSPSTLYWQGKIPIYLGQLGDRFLTDPGRGFDVKVLARPKGKKRAGFVNVTAAAINARSKHPLEAWSLLEYLTSRRVQEYIARTEALGGFIPALKEGAYSEHLFPHNPEVRRVVLDELSFSVPIMKTTRNSELASIVNPIFDRLAMRQISIEEAMNEISLRVTEMLSD